MDIVVKSDSYGISNARGLAELARAWIQRSGTRPFDFRLRVNPYGVHSRDSGPEHLIPLIDVLLTACTRWSHVELHLECYCLAQLEFLYWGDTGTFQFPKLQHLSVSAGRKVFQRMNRWLNINHDTTPALRSISMCGSRGIGAMDMIAPMSPPLDVSFGVLTKLSIGSFASQENLFHVLSQCVRVRQLDIDVGVLMFRPPPPQTMDIYLPELLSLRVTSYSGFNGLMDWWTFPSLQSMYIRLEWEVIKDEWQRGFPVNAGWPMTAFQDFATRSMCSITELVLRDIELKPGHLSAIITSVHLSLQYLHVNGVGGNGVLSVDDSVLSMLTWDNASPSNICPLLKKIEFVDCLIFTQGIFAQMVMSRTKAGAGQVVCLEEVWVECHEDCGMTQMYILTDFNIVKDMLPVFHVTL